MENQKTSSLDISSKNLSADFWFDSGVRRLYDPENKQFVQSSEASAGCHFVFQKKIKDPSNSLFRPITFLPGFPTGSFDWIKINAQLEKKGSPDRLFVEYIGQGDSDKPEEYKYSTFERADLVEATWRDNLVDETFIVTFDYSSLVAMELLRRQQEKLDNGLELRTRITKVLFINGGYFTDGHSHPIMTTPLLKTFFGKMSMKMVQDSPMRFRRMMKGMWGKEYRVSNEELNEVYKAISKRGGMLFMHTAAGFVDEHKRNQERLDLLSIYLSSRNSVSFHIIGSDRDQFEPKQIKLARQRLGEYAVDIRVISGGHMIILEQPKMLTEIILELTK